MKKFLNLLKDDGLMIPYMGFVALSIFLMLKAFAG